MKKLLSLLALAMLLPMAMNAQLLSNSDLTVQRAPYALKTWTQHLYAPARIDLADNQRIMGHYDTEDLTDSGLGITGLPGVIPISTVLSPEELAFFQGGKIVKFRVGLAAATTISRVFAAPVPNGNLGNVGTITEWTCSVNAAGWNEIEIETPYEINLDENTWLMIGFDYRQTSSNYPISAVEVGDIYPSYIYYQNAWQNVGLDSYGNLSLQCVVESDNYPDYLVSVNKLNVEAFVKKGNSLTFSFNTYNMGVATVEAEACTYNVLIDGELVNTITNPTAFGNQPVTIADFYPTDNIASGRHTLTIQVNTLNGEPVEKQLSVSKTFVLYENSFDRQMHVIEEFTSNSCTYCPLGISMLKVLMGLRDDIAMVAIHGNQSSVDPSNTTQCDTLFNYMGAGGWPYAAFDRSTGLEDDENIVVSIGYYEQYHQEVAEALSSFLDYVAESPSFATININSTLDPETNEAKITIDGQVTPDFAQVMGEDAKLSVFLTEDSLIYRQLNLGTWVQRFQHDHVFRVALGSVFGNAINIDGETFKNEFTYTIPSSWKTDKMEVVAFISRPLANGATGVYTDMYINQANKRKLGEFDEPTFIRGDVNGDSEVNIADVTELIILLLSGEEAPAVTDCDLSGNFDIGDVTALITFILRGEWND